MGTKLCLKSSFNKTRQLEINGAVCGPFRTRGYSVYWIIYSYLSLNKKNTNLVYRDKAKFHNLRI